MKTLISFLIVSALTFNAQAKQLSLFPELDEQDAVQALLTYCQTEGLECYVDPYDVNSFNADEKLEKISSQLYDAESSWHYEVETNVKYVVTHEYMKQTGGTDALKYFLKNGKIKAAFGFSPNEEQCTESEYCSMYEVYIFLENGQQITIHFDFNT